MGLSVSDWIPSPHRVVDAFAPKKEEPVVEPVRTYAKVIADSTYQGGPRLTTFEVRLHRFVLAELNTHRVFSRNSASSRAIPLRKQLEKVRDHPAIPVVFPAEQKGMQGGAEIANPKDAEAGWLRAAKAAAMHAQWLGDIGVHKSIANRLLEPFMWHTVVITGTAFDNFFAQRSNPDAQPEIRVAAEAMYDAYVASTPRRLSLDQWHTPYVSDEDFAIIHANVGDLETAWMVAVRVSSARAARTSYETQGGQRDMNEDQNLYQRLVTSKPMHASPLEHPAQPDQGNRHWVNIARRTDPEAFNVELPQYGNLLGWRQHRFDVEARLGYQSFS